MQCAAHSSTSWINVIRLGLIRYSELAHLCASDLAHLHQLIGYSVAEPTGRPMDRRTKVELFEAIRRSMSTGPGRSRSIPEAGGSSADGSASPGKFGSTRAKADGAESSEFGAGDGFHRRDFDCR